MDKRNLFYTVIYRVQIMFQLGCEQEKTPIESYVQDMTKILPYMQCLLLGLTDKTRYFALLTRKWQYFILKRQGTGTEHVAITTSKCVPSGIFLGCNIAAKFQ